MTTLDGKNSCINHKISSQLLQFISREEILITRLMMIFPESPEYIGDKRVNDLERLRRSYPEQVLHVDYNTETFHATDH